MSSSSTVPFDDLAAYVESVGGRDVLVFAHAAAARSAAEDLRAQCFRQRQDENARHHQVVIEQAAERVVLVLVRHPVQA